MVLEELLHFESNFRDERILSLILRTITFGPNDNLSLQLVLMIDETAGEKHHYEMTSLPLNTNHAEKLIEALTLGIEKLKDGD